ncbi:MAG TPA: GDSL-type esterase/lipase family protein, partial [Actinomycetota bacterium]|nr:GDSL-type esterase/lipase family protein [Actinomycetota bacterium]
MAAAVLLGGEVGLAMRREFFREGPKQQIRGEFGDPDSPELRFVVMGDSTSVGVGADPENSFPWLLAEKLGATFRVKLFVVGRSSARAADVAQVQLPQAISLEPDLLLMEIGANDATHLTSINKVKASIGRVLAVASKTNTLLVVAGPPNMGTTRAFAEPLRSLSGWSGRRVQAAIESIVLPADIPYIDLAAG